MDLKQASEIIDNIITQRFEMTHAMHDSTGMLGHYQIEYGEYRVRWDYHFAIDLLSIFYNNECLYQEDGSDVS